LSFFIDGATGGIIVVLQTIVFLGVFLIAPKYGYISARLKIRQANKRIENGF
jgi:manganese/iron transport system permease protein